MQKQSVPSSKHPLQVSVAGMYSADESRLTVFTVKEVYYPKYSPTRPFYEACRTPNGGYGGLLSVTFYSTADAITFFDAMETAKGPSLGTNFTLR